MNLSKFFILIFCLIQFKYVSDAKKNVRISDNSLKKFRIITARIVNGERAEHGMFPYQVFLLLLNKDFIPVSMCGGSIISPTEILTAAHCLLDENFKKTLIVGITFNEINITSSDIEPSNMRVSRDYYIHREYDPNDLKADIGLIRINKPISYSDSVQPIKIAKELPADTTQCVVSGWGSTSNTEGEGSMVLLYADVFYREQAICEKLTEMIVPPGLVCTDVQDAGVCSGDSGGPLVCNGQQIGINAFVLPGPDKECAGYMPAFYTDVTKLRDFINDPVKYSTWTTSKKTTTVDKQTTTSIERNEEEADALAGNTAVGIYSNLPILLFFTSPLYLFLQNFI